MAFQDTMVGLPRPWSDVDENVVNLEKLRLLCSSEQALRREGYVTEQLSPSVLLLKLRCRDCGRKMRLPEPARIAASPDDTISNSPGEMVPNSSGTTAIARNDICDFHPGHVINLHFTCCHAHVSIRKGCQINMAHTAPDNHMEMLRAHWTYFVAPKPISLFPAIPTIAEQRRQRRARFTNDTIPFPRSAVALDFEFGVSILNEPEIIRMTVVDFFTQQVLIDSLVKPFVAIKSYQTKWSGVTSTDMRNAVITRTCIFGRDAAREKLLEFVNADTVIVVHGGPSDMGTLRLIHPHIVDTHILETYFEPVVGGRSLKNLCEKKLGLQIQTGRGHDSHEDALACRELAVWMMNLIPEV